MSIRTAKELLEVEAMQLKEKEEELKRWKTKLEEERGGMSTSEIQRKESQIVRKEKKLASMKEAHDKKFIEKFQGVFQEKYKKMFEVVAELRVEGSYNFIFYDHKGMGMGQILFEGNQRNDISEVVIKKMGLPMDTFNKLIEEMDKLEGGTAN